MSHMESPDQVSAALGADLPWPHPAAATAISAFVDRGPFGVAVFDTELRVLLVSQGLATLHGRDASRTVGKKIEEVLPAPYGDQAAQRLRQVLSSGIPEVDTETWGTFSDPHANRSFTSSFYRLDDASGSPLGVVVLVTETTELRSAVTTATSAAAQLELLERVTEVLSGNHKVAEVTRTVLADRGSGRCCLGRRAHVGEGRHVGAVGLGRLDRCDRRPTSTAGCSRCTSAALRHAAVSNDHSVGITCRM